MWEESIRQTSDMVNSWLLESRDGSKNTSEDLRTLALHVLAYVGFQKSYPFTSVAKTTGIRQPSTYRDSLSIILQNVLVVLVLPSIAFQIPFLPTKWRQIGWAITDFREYMLEQLTQEKRLIAEGKPGSGTLMSNLVRASEVQYEVTGVGRSERTYMDGKSHEMRPLSVDEILGNVFVFNFAGHDTTAISLAYSVLLLVAHPGVQDWIGEELDFYLQTDKSETWRYEIVFPRLKRCLAVLVRLHSVESRFLVKANSQASLRPCGYTIRFLVCLNIQAVSLASSKGEIRKLSFLRIRLSWPI